MKKRNILLIIIIAAAVSVVVLLIVLNPDRQITTDKNNLKYFRNSYDECRREFNELAAGFNYKFFNVETGSAAVRSKSDENLFIDYCFIPGWRNPSRLLIITSGIHGIEGFAGSAVQRMFMKEMLAKGFNNQETGVLLIHGINAWGFKNRRRVTENNVDLNRNFKADQKLFSEENSGYPQLDDFLNPKEKASLGFFSGIAFKTRTIFRIMKNSVKTLRQAILQGQHEFPEGIFFGGKEFEQQKSLINRIILPKVEPYRFIVEIDLHTGYGERHRLHLFPPASKDKKTKDLTDEIFKGYRIDWGDAGDFYSASGDFTAYLGNLMPGKTYVPMVFEFGTADNLAMFGSMNSLHAMVIENQGFHRGYESEIDKNAIERRFLELYYPSSEAWRSEVIRQARDIFPVVIARLQKK